jgi:hydroxymethylglutaryl-CoA lyase
MNIVECPRDAMQGIAEFIPTETKIRYLNALLQCGFHTLDFGSFVSHAAIPQMRDTSQVLSQLQWNGSQTKLLAIVANIRGATEACHFDEISFLGFPFSVSETFQLRNTNSTISESMRRVEEIQNLCTTYGKTLVIYISMGFGNPYGEEWSAAKVSEWVNRLSAIGIKIISLSDTIGVAVPETISPLFLNLIPAFPSIEFGAHFHTTPAKWREKVEAAWKAGCRRFDGALRGYGGCPMADDKLTGNMPTEHLVQFASEQNAETGIQQSFFEEALRMSASVFPS